MLKELVQQVPALNPRAFEDFENSSAHDNVTYLHFGLFYSLFLLQLLDQNQTQTCWTSY